MTNRYSSSTEKPFKQSGIGLAYTRMCGACGKPGQQLGGKVLRVKGLRTFVAACCSTKKTP